MFELIFLLKFFVADLSIYRTSTNAYSPRSNCKDFVNVMSLMKIIPLSALMA